MMTRFSPRARFMLRLILLMLLPVVCVAGSLIAYMHRVNTRRHEVAKWDSSWRLHSFCGRPYIAPNSLMQGRDGALYGTVLGGLFRLNTDGSGFRILHPFLPSFPRNGLCPQGGLVQDPTGTLYGATIQGGRFDSGTIYRLNPDGSGFRCLHAFSAQRVSRPMAPETNKDGAYPEGGLFTIQGRKYILTRH
jgi:uncharacterized repeat protein (TIGR03803 family)